MVTTFTKEEKEKIRNTLTVVVEDLRSLFNIADTDQLRYEFNLWENETRNTYSLYINPKGIHLSLHYSDWYMNLDKVKLNGTVKMCSIKDYNLAFLFLQKYEKIREDIREEVLKNQTDKKRGMKRVEALFDKYTKEATIEVEMPETINKSSIEITSEDGKNVGKVKIGPVSLKILASENVNIVERKEPTKVKKK